MRGSPGEHGEEEQAQVERPARGKNITHGKPRSKPRSERAQERKDSLTYRVLGYKLALFLALRFTT